MNKIKKFLTELFCSHTDWDIDKQIRVIKCKKCGKKAWLRKVIDMFPN